MEFRIAAIFSLISTLVVSHQAHVLKLLDPNTPVLSPAQRYAAWYGSDGEKYIEEYETGDVVSGIDQGVAFTYPTEGYETGLWDFVDSEYVSGAAVDVPLTQPLAEFSEDPGLVFIMTLNENGATMGTDVYGGYSEPQDSGYVSAVGNLNLGLLLALWAALSRYPLTPDFLQVAPEVANFLTGSVVAIPPAAQGFDNIFDPVNLDIYRFPDEFAQFQKLQGSFDAAAAPYTLLKGGASVDAISLVPPTVYSASQNYRWQQPYIAPYSPVATLLGYPQPVGTLVAPTPQAPSTTNGALQKYLWKQLYTGPSSPLSMSLGYPQINDAGAVAVPPALPLTYGALQNYPQTFRPPSSSFNTLSYPQVAISPEPYAVPHTDQKDYTYGIPSSSFNTLSRCYPVGDAGPVAVPPGSTYSYAAPRTYPQ